MTDQETMCNLAAVAADASQRAAGATSEAEKTANRRMTYFAGFMILVVLVFIIDQRAKADARDKRDVEHTKMLMEQKRADVAIKVWAMSTFLYTGAGQRFTLENAKEAFKFNHLALPTFSKLPPPPKVTFWPDYEFDIFKSIVEKEPEIMNDQEKLIKEFTEEVDKRSE